MLLVDDIGRRLMYDEDDAGRELSSCPIVDDRTRDESINFSEADLLPALPIRHGTFHSGRIEVLDTGREPVRELSREPGRETPSSPSSEIISREPGRETPSSPSSDVRGVEEVETSPSLRAGELEATLAGRETPSSAPEALWLGVPNTESGFRRSLDPHGTKMLAALGGECTRFLDDNGTKVLASLGCMFGLKSTTLESDSPSSPNPTPSCDCGRETPSRPNMLEPAVLRDGGPRGRKPSMDCGRETPSRPNMLVPAVLRDGGPRGRKTVLARLIPVAGRDTTSTLCAEKGSTDVWLGTGAVSWPR
jgi:hypothetical protein